jgi:hypothetical protein
VYCITCNYKLDGLTARTCPECGRAFDSTIPATFSPTPRPVPLRVYRIVRATFWTLACARLAQMTFNYLAFATARIELGHWPVNDTMGDNFGATRAAYVWAGPWILTYIVGVYIAPFVVMLLPWLMYPPHARRGGLHRVGMIAIGLGLLLLGWLWQEWDPHGVFRWITD